MKEETKARWYGSPPPADYPIGVLSRFQKQPAAGYITARRATWRPRARATLGDTKAQQGASAQMRPAKQDQVGVWRKQQKKINGATVPVRVFLRAL